MEFLRVSPKAALNLKDSDEEIYSPFHYPSENKYYIFREVYESGYTLTTFTEAQLYGITPMNPAKPMFKK